MGVDVVVVNYRTPHDLHGFLNAFREVQREVPCSLIVSNVDPEPDDELVAELQLETIDVPVFYSNWAYNCGYANACNEAATVGRRRTIAFFNADTRILPGVLKECDAHLWSDPTYAALGPRQIDDDGLITHGGIFGTHDHPSFEGRWKRRNSPEYADVRDDAISVSGSAYFIKRPVWTELTECEIYRQQAPESIGAFLPTEHYYEETWCSYHAHSHGYKIVYYGAVEMVHRWHQSSPVGGKAEKAMPRSRERFRAACEAHGIPHD